MFRLFWFAVVLGGAIWAQSVTAQSPSASPTASPSVAAVSPKPVSPTPTPTPTPNRSPSREELLNSLSPADVQAALGLLKKNFANPEAVDENELNRATLQGLLVRLSRGVMLLPGKETPPAEGSAPLYAEILEDHIGYIRPGAITAAAVQALDKKLAEFAAKKVDAVIMDLRASESGDYASAAEVSKRFVPKGKTLFSLRKQDKQDRTFMSDRDPAYNGLIVVLIDADTLGPAEAIAVALRAHNKSLLVGRESAGGGVEYSDLALPGGKTLRVAVAQCIGADGRRLYPEGVTPDLPVDMPAADKRQIFRLSVGKGIASFTHEVERPHLNEAALIAGTNPELETSEQRRLRAQANLLVDAVLQRGIDVITSVEIYRKRE